MFIKRKKQHLCIFILKNSILQLLTQLSLEILQQRLFQLHNFRSMVHLFLKAGGLPRLLWEESQGERHLV